MIRFRCSLSVLLGVIAVLCLFTGPLSAREPGESLLIFFNGERLHSDFKPLAQDDTFELAANSHAREMQRNGYFDFKSPSGTRPIHRLRLYTDTFLGRINLNIYKLTGRSPAGVVRYVKQQWHEDESLRENIMNPSSQRIGIGLDQREAEETIYLVIYTGQRVRNYEDYRRRVRRRIHERVNRFRKRRGLAMLRSDTVFRSVAQRHSRDMVKRGFFSHMNPDGQNPLERMQQFNRDYASRILENLAYHTPAPPTILAQKIVEDWKNSPGHRENMMTEGVVRSGIGVSFSYEKNLVFVAHKFGNKYVKKVYVN